MDETPLPIPSDYDPFLEDLKERIRSPQVRAAAAVNRELVFFTGTSEIESSPLKRWRDTGLGLSPNFLRISRKRFPK